METTHGSKISLIMMIVISVILSYFLTMTIILRRNATHHRNKLFQSLLMGAWMGVIMIVLMAITEKKLSKEYAVILMILILAVAILSYWIRQQKTIDQDQFMLGMIEHHQMAIDMAKLVKPKVTDSRLKKIVSDIISSQQSEIDHMYQILTKRGVDIGPIVLFR